MLESLGALEWFCCAECSGARVQMPPPLPSAASRPCGGPPPLAFVEVKIFLGLSRCIFFLLKIFIHLTLGAKTMHVYLAISLENC